MTRFRMAHIMFSTSNGPPSQYCSIYVMKICIQAKWPGFCSMKRLGWDASPSQGYPKFGGTHFYTMVERGIVTVQCLAQEHNTVSQPVLEPGPLVPESSTLTMRPPRLSNFFCYFWNVILHVWRVFVSYNRTISETSVPFRDQKT